MKIYQIILFSICLFFLFQGLIAQPKEDKKIMYKSWITLSEKNTRKFIGLLYAVEDSSLLIANSYLKDDYINNNFTYQKMDFSELDKIKLRKRGRVGGWMFLGALTGFTIGAIIGAADGDDPICTGNNYLFPCHQRTAGEKAMTAGFAGIAYGVILGSVIGSFKIKIPINGDANLFEANKQRLKGYAYQKM